MPREALSLIGVLGAGLVFVCTAGGDFAVEVLEFRPAPGQFVNNSYFNDPDDALGPPLGAGTFEPANQKVVSLGGFGGSITLRMAHTVRDDPRNPLGMDAIVFGNAFWASGDPQVRWAEVAVIEICRDTNGNGIADDAWYLIPGSSLASPPTGGLTARFWDNDPETPTPPANLAWWPAGFASPYSTTGYIMPAEFSALTLVNTDQTGGEAYWGYAELSPSMLLGDRSGSIGGSYENSLDDPEDDPSIDPEHFYTVPDDPLTIGVDAGSGGGDAFDIAWAIDPVTGQLANLDGFDFIRIRTGVDVLHGPIGEMSAEIGGVADVRVPGDFDGDDCVDGEDLAELLAYWGEEWSIADLTRDGETNGEDLAVLLANWGD